MFDVLIPTSGKGLNSFIDSGIPLSLFKDYVQSFHKYISFVKFGWGLSVIDPSLHEKILLLDEHNILFHFGGSLFEKAFIENKLDEYNKFLLSHNASYVEISDGTVNISRDDKSRLIEKFSKNFSVLSEVGYKDQIKSEHFSPARWIENIAMDFNSGASFVITETRETGNSGMCRPNGDLRFGLIEEFKESSIDFRNVIFEAPTTEIQVFFIQNFGVDVNLSNLPFASILNIVSLRSNLRSETLLGV